MSTLETTVARLRRFNAGVSAGKVVRDEAILEPEVRLEGRASPEQALHNESIILKRKRPVLAVRENVAELEFDAPEDARLWKEPLEKAQEALRKACCAVGRIDLTGHEDLEWVGTGWLVAPDVMVTNRHVAVAFAGGNPLVFSTGPGGQIGAAIDFLQEADRDARHSFEITAPLYIEPRGGPDLAFFRVEKTSATGNLAMEIDLCTRLPNAAAQVAVIGYPARDSRIPDQALMHDIYGELYDKKRLAPGAVTQVEATRVLHNCTTLGGNSGSVVVDLDSGLALGLHFGGRFLATNYAVRADTVKQRLDDLNQGRLRSRSAPTPRGGEMSPRRRRVEIQAGSASVTVPLTITVSLGTPSVGRATKRVTTASSPVLADEDVAEEGKPADYEGRGGYDVAFLGAGFEVGLPSVERGVEDVLTFADQNGDEQTVLKYQHFSVVMRASRRMCVFSAVNIDGATSRKTKRAAWRTDPRIAKDAQIMDECYGAPPKFSRGHMTRREDPAWGNAETAKRGNVDSMHVTNTTPQMQAFNSPIWLALEDYALEHAREDDMKISVFTGPYFDYDGIADPMIDGVHIPRVFWKIIAFVHDETKKLCATGYEMSQEANLPKDDEEFVFDDFVSQHLNRSTQVSIASIAERTGLDFGGLADVDPLASVDEAVAAAAPLERFEQIRFR